MQGGLLREEGERGGDRGRWGGSLRGGGGERG